MLAFRIMVVGVAAVLLSACEKPPPSAMDRAEAELAQLKAARLLREAEDKTLAPFDSSLRVESLSAADKKRLCGNDYHRIAVGWPIKKALACGGDHFRLVSDSSGGIRIWQDCISGTAMCLTVGEMDGRVSTWNH